MNYKVGNDFLEKLNNDLEKKYLYSGLRLGGSIKDNKICLYTIDEDGKHSKFDNRVFYGKVEGDTLNGKLSVSHFVILLLGILAGFCIESIVMAIISDSLSSIVFPIAIIVFEILYFIFIKRVSAENDGLINKYLEDCVIENQYSE